MPLQSDAIPDTPNTLGTVVDADINSAVDEPMVTYTVISAMHQLHT